MTDCIVKHVCLTASSRWIRGGQIFFQKIVTFMSQLCTSWLLAASHPFQNFFVNLYKRFLSVTDHVTTAEQLQLLKDHNNTNLSKDAYNPQEATDPHISLHRILDFPDFLI